MALLKQKQLQLSGSIPITGSLGIDGDLFVTLTQKTLEKIVVFDDSNDQLYYTTASLGDEDWYDGDTFISTSKNVIVTASIDIAGGADLPHFFLIKSGSKTVAKFNNEGVLVLGKLDHTPTPVSGGIFYSSSGELFFGT